MTTLVEKSKMTVDGLIAKRHEPRTYEEKVRHALDVVEMHAEYASTAIKPSSGLA